MTIQVFFEGQSKLFKDITEVEYALRWEYEMIVLRDVNYREIWSDPGEIPAHYDDFDSIDSDELRFHEVRNIIGYYYT